MLLSFTFLRHLTCKAAVAVVFALHFKIATYCALIWIFRLTTYSDSVYWKDWGFVLSPLCPFIYKTHLHQMHINKDSSQPAFLLFEQPQSLNRSGVNLEFAVLNEENPSIKGLLTTFIFKDSDEIRSVAVVRKDMLTSSGLWVIHRAITRCSLLYHLLLSIWKERVAPVPVLR